MAHSLPSCDSSNDGTVICEVPGTLIDADCGGMESVVAAIGYTKFPGVGAGFRTEDVDPEAPKRSKGGGLSCFGCFLIFLPFSSMSRT